MLACALKHETDHISCDEYFREPFLPDEGVAFAIDKEDDASEYNVDRSSKEGRRDKDEK